MTDVRQVSTTSHGLFATKAYKTGDILLSATPPLVRLAPASKEEEQSLVNTYFASSTLDSDEATLLEFIDVPVPDGDEIVSSSIIDVKRARKTLQSMVQAALCFVHTSLDEDVKEKLLSLYHPPVEGSISNSSTETTGHTAEEQVIVQLSRWALDFVKSLARDEPSPLKDALASKRGTMELQQVMLIWACNAFAGGRIYDVLSRINHSCNPNSVVVVDPTNEQAQLLRAATEIHAGSEITISYLGSWLYADAPTRQSALVRDKFFTCHCERCFGAHQGKAFPDMAQSIPCPVCHPRVSRQLSEDVQYDDDGDVQYVCPFQPCPNCGFAHPNDKASTTPKKQGTYDKLFDTNQSVVNKVVTFLRDHIESTSKRHSTRSTATGEANDDSEECELEVFNEQLTQHLTMASSVLGAKHWTTNLIMLHLLDETLSGLHANMLTNTMDGDDEEDKEATMETIASAIDMLERLLRFVNGLGLHLHMGHLLSNVVVGTARALLTLGDVKSQKYAATWVSKLEDDDAPDSGFIHHFESPGLQKVAETIKSAWQRHPDSERPEKRTKR